MRQIRLIVEYDGTNYAGWQVQPNGLAIQQVMEEALARIVGAAVRLRSSGRTDAGVHALGMVACFTTDVAHPLSAFREGANCLLPPAIAVRAADEVPLDFDPRRDALGKHYRYTIHNDECRSPLARQTSWHLRTPLDTERMGRAATAFVGEHDFAAFRTTGCAAQTTVRRIDAVVVSQNLQSVVIDVHGSGFLRNMVRIMAGTLVEIGLGRLPVERVAQCLADPTICAGPTAPAQGLCLMQVQYGETKSA
jgi:tRNA pseudouridine38-40 synthase